MTCHTCILWTPHPLYPNQPVTGQCGLVLPPWLSSNLDFYSRAQVTREDDTCSFHLERTTPDAST